MRGASRMDRERLGVADVREVREQREAFDELAGAFEAGLKTEAE